MTSSYSIENILGASLKTRSPENFSSPSKNVSKLSDLKWRKERGNIAIKFNKIPGILVL